MQRGNQFSKHECACRNIHPFAFAGPGAKPNNRPHAGECQQHADHPEPDRHSAIEILDANHRQQAHGADRNRALPRYAPANNQQIGYACQPFTNCRVDTGNIRQCIGNGGAHQSSFSLLPAAAPLFEAAVCVLARDVGPAAPI